MIKKILSYVEKLLLKWWYYLGMDMQALGRKRHMDLAYKGWDFVRYSSLELIAHEIKEKKLVGSVAELWVYQWDFAAKINELFPDRDFYLFDTFQWFSHKDTHIEQQESYSTGKQDFSCTSVDLVLQKMKHPAQCVIKQWYFPDTTEGVADSFVFVSLDPDLYKPIYDGLCFFYPRLVKWWYIFIHDYNNSGYKWAKKAVHQFCDEHNISFFPLSDNWGTAVIGK